ncbi:uncharacterized protein FOMMEDRAFT_115046 [Fomitiporia mediterranea MF3/22]|uniref:Lipid droplet-associated perilipin protein n=1 Tax=Fomitiporia mediterranea (strain MF3/22) TaxID=694068 RepID=R7SH65_FOMME|nr:uncharacterized protein FOMMEDRAFT_115046 [Fomitiporia mediterranea MF3/22]EJC97725.1 hypothetical protein FOMMEDRAFT_115046 [Fomitiporia mediterranea MF3/22]
MATETQTAPSVLTAPPNLPQYTVLSRVASIPLISDSLAVLHATLLNNALTKMPYSTAQAIGSAAFRVSEPIQARLAPVINRADGIANKAVDVVESRYPYPFHAPTEEIYGHLKQHSEHAYGVANKTIDDKVRTPAYGIVKGVDQRFTPVVDRFASVVNSINSKKTDPDSPTPDGPATGTPNDEFQYRRAFRLSLSLKDSLVGLTNEQLKQIQEHNILVQKAAATAHSITSTISTSYDAAATRVHALSDTMVGELHGLQTSASALPAQAQSSLGGLSERLGPVINEVKEILRSDAPVKEKLARLRQTVEQQIQPILANATARLQDAVKAVRSRAESVTANGKSAPAPNGTVPNGDKH